MIVTLLDCCLFSLDMNTLESVKSFAILDIETSDSPRSSSFAQAKITEICVHVISAVDVRNGDSLKSPRVIHKLRMAFNPARRIHPNTSTGLNNFMLEYESRFDINSANILISFLNRLQKPTCLVAHNGMKFDFPLLKRALHKLGVELPPDFLCVDSLIAFLTIDESDRSDIAVSNALAVMNDDNNILDFLQIIETIQQEDISSFPKKRKMEDHIWTATTSCLISEETGKNVNGNLSDESLLQTQKSNETSPMRPTSTIGIGIMKKKSLDDDIDALTKSKCRRSLFTSPNGSKLSPLFMEKFPPKGFYRLGDLYRRIFNTNPQNAHQAEADVFLLRKIILRYGEKFIKFTKEYAVPISSLRNF